jgi:hypothetical protein
MNRQAPRPGIAAQGRSSELDQVALGREYMPHAEEPLTVCVAGFRVADEALTAVEVVRIKL